MRALIVIIGMSLTTTAFAQVPYDVKKQNEIIDRIKIFDFELEAHGFSSQIVSCGPMIDFESGSRYGEHSYGAVCTIKIGPKEQKISICDDDEVGHFAVNKRPYANKDRMIKFIEANCIGG